MKTPTIGTILTTFKRPHLLEMQISAIRGQAVDSEILVWRNDDWDDSIFAGLNWVKASSNMGVWHRFHLALQYNTDFVCIFDDDTIPGPEFYQHCLSVFDENPRVGVLSAFGFQFKTKELTKETWNERKSCGWKNPVNKLVQVDWSGHCWFMPNEILRAFHYYPRLTKYPTCGEDAHLAYVTQQMGLGCFVPPHNDDKSNWGSTMGNVGQDKNAAFRSPGQRAAMLDTIQTYRDAGWQWLID